MNQNVPAKELGPLAQRFLRAGREEEGLPEGSPELAWPAAGQEVSCLQGFEELFGEFRHRAVEGGHQQPEQGGEDAVAGVKDDPAQ